MYNKELLHKIIQTKREEMVLLGIEKGLNSLEVIDCSQQLDDLLNAYMGI